MKNFFALLFFAITITSLSAQIQKGTVFLGGTMGFTSLSAGGSSATVISLAPTVGYMLSNRFALGSSLGLSLAVAGGTSFTTLSFSPFARGYFNKSGMARFFGQFNVGIQSESASGSSNLNSLKGGLAIGADFFLNDNVAIEGALGFERANYLDTDFPIVNDGFNTIGLSFGVVAFIGRKNKE